MQEWGRTRPPKSRNVLHCALEISRPDLHDSSTRRPVFDYMDQSTADGFVKHEYRRSSRLCDACSQERCRPLCKGLVCLEAPFIVAGFEKGEKEQRRNRRKMIEFHHHKRGIKIDKYDRQKGKAGGTAWHRQECPSRVSFGGGTDYL